MNANDPTATRAATAAQCPHLADYDPMGAEQLANPYPIWEQARKAAPVFYSEALDLWAVSRYEDILKVIGDNESYSVANSLIAPLPPESVRHRMPQYPWARTLVNMDPPEHTPARRVIQAPFTQRSLRAVRPVFETHARDLIRQAASAGQMDFVEDFAFPFTLSNLGTVLGIPASEFPVMRRGVEATFRVLSYAQSEQETLASAEVLADFVEYLDDFIAARRAHPGDDYTSEMIAALEAQGGGPGLEHEISSHVFTLIGAGFETSAMLLVSAFHTLLTHRPQWELLRADPGRIPAAVEEVFRYSGPIKMIFRTTRRQVAIGDAVIPAGARVCLLLASAGRDEAVYERPNEFDIRRVAPTPHLGLGRWVHFCPGGPLARLETHIAIDQFLEQLPGATLVPDQEIQHRVDIRLAGIEHLYITW